jgi:DNA-binding NtrC family response regulator
MSDSLTILLADDEEIVRLTVGDYLRDSGHEVVEFDNGAAAANAIANRDFDLAILDIRMPDKNGLEVLERAQELRPELPVVLISGHGNMETVIEALRIGAADFLTKPVRLRELDAVQEKVLRLGRLQRQGRILRQTIGHLQGDRQHHLQMIGESQVMEAVRSQIRQAVEARCDTILITGETGTGKEVVAREIHRCAGGSDTPFIAVSCPAVPDELVESELFGHVRGSFTGAVADKAGCFELAHDGTLFLDEVGDLSAAAQAKLLRVLETRAVRRVGGSKEVRVDTRVVAATNAPLDEMISENRFRQDLYYRLALFTIHLPPLRERREDIKPLADHFLQSFATARGVEGEGISADARRQLETYDYPGNARELRNLVERAAMLSGGGLINTDHLRLPQIPTSSPAARKTESERDLIVRTLDECKWNRREVARRLDMPYSTLRYKMKQSGL